MKSINLVHNGVKTPAFIVKQANCVSSGVIVYLLKLDVTKDYRVLAKRKDSTLFSQVIPSLTKACSLYLETLCCYA